MMRTGRRAGPTTLLLSIVLVIAACGSATLTPTPAPSNAARDETPSGSGKVELLPSIPAATATPAPTPVAVGELAFHALPQLDELIRGAGISAFAGGPAGFVVLGNDRATGALASWTSPDGGDWVRTWLPGTTFGGGTPHELVGGSFGYLALGWTDPVSASEVIWSSPDGVTWRQTAGTGLPVGQLSTLAAGRAGAIAAIQQASAPAIAISRDGQFWHQVVLPGRAVTSVFNAIALPDGFLVLGSTEPPTGSDDVETTPVVWTSPDGLAWNDAPGMADTISHLDSSIDTWQQSPWGEVGGSNDIANVGVVTGSAFAALPAPPVAWGHLVGGPAGLAWVQGGDRMASCSTGWQYTGRAWQPLAGTHVDRPCIDAAGPFVIGSAAIADAMLVLGQLGELPDRVAWLIRAPDRPPIQTSANDANGPPAAAVPDPLAIRIERPRSCPTLPTTLAEFHAIERRVEVACFGNTPMTFQAWVVDPGEGYGGVCGPFRPAWIRECVLPDYLLAIADDKTDSSADILHAMRAPAATGNLKGVGRWVHVTGHLDDPASPTCRTASDDVQFAADFEVPPALAVLECRLVFVVTDIVTVH